jgi:hypothetical protein
VTTGIQSKGVDLDNIFDPYVTGTSPGLTGVQTAGIDVHTRYAPLVYGTAAAATGILCKVGGAGSFVDLNTLFAAKGTANYALPINGQTYTSTGSVIGGGAVLAKLDFEIGNSGWTLISSGTNATTKTLASGAVPGGAVSVQISDTWLNASGDTDAGTTFNTCTTYTAIPSTGTVGCAITESHSATSGQTTHRIVIMMKNSVGAVISTTTTTFLCITSRG